MKGTESACRNGLSKKLFRRDRLREMRVFKRLVLEEYPGLEMSLFGNPESILF